MSKTREEDCKRKNAYSQDGQYNLGASTSEVNFFSLQLWYPVWIWVRVISRQYPLIVAQNNYPS